jgi:CheY-like chemotaxis protein
MPDLTPRDDIKKKVSEILKRVDRLIRAGEIDQAMREIIQAKEIDPKNVYVFAYEERITYLREEHEKHKQQEKTRKDAEEAARRRDEEAQRKIEEALPKRQPQVQQKEVSHPQHEAPPISITPPLQTTEDTRSVEELEQELREAEAELLRKEEQRPGKPEDKSAPPDRLAHYQRELEKAWEDGILTPFEEEQLKDLRMLLGITIQEHFRLTKQTQLESYLKAFRQSWSSGAIAPERASELSDLRTRYQISAEESDKLEAEVLWEVRGGAQPATLVIIDDDVKLLNLVSEILREASYNVRSFTTSDDAYRFLKDSTPDMIISDINLETSTMGGFTFYEKIRELDHLQNVPFIFLSGLTDEVLIRTGKELGVDDYLTKPFSDETLLATIKGKLKRFKKLSLAAKKR